MKISLYIIFLASTFFYCCTESKSDTISTQTKSTPSPFFQAFEDSLKTKMAIEKIPGLAVVVVKDSTILYQNALGVKENGKVDTLNINSVFRIGSVSKGFSAVLTGILVENGLLSWNDKIVDLYREFQLSDPAQTQRITIRHLLSHTSGLPRHAYTNLIEDGLSFDKIITRLAGLKLIGTEGRYYAYQNAAFAIIEKVLESKSDSSFSSLLKSKIFDPAHMVNSSSSYDDLIENKNSAQPHRYNFNKESYIPIKQTKKYYNTVSAGGINTSISDMGNWIQILLGNHPKIISVTTLDTIFDPIVKVNTWRYSRRWGVRRSYYAMGWRVLKYKDRLIVFHGGYVNGYRSEIALDRKNKIGICILSNAPHWYTGQIIPDFFTSYFKSDSILFTASDNN